MDEALYTRDAPKKPAQKKAEQERRKKQRTMGDKLKNETTAADNYRKKLRHGKADNRLIKEEVKKAKRLKKQGRKKAFEEVAITQQLRSQVVDANEDGNVGVDAFALGMEVGEVATSKVKSSFYSKKIHRKYASKKDGAEGSNEVSKQSQRNRIKKSQQQRVREKEATNGIERFGKSLSERMERLGEGITHWIKSYLEEHAGVLSSAVLLLVMIVAVAGMISSCSVIATGVQNITVATSFTAEDDTIRAVEADYVELEQELQERIDNIETDYPDYDEYNYILAEISHNPFELAALLTVLFEDYSQDEVQSMLQTIFEKQYVLEIESVVEIRTRTETRTGQRWVQTGEAAGIPIGHFESYEYEVEVEYEYHILNVTLTNLGITAIIQELGLNADQLQRYPILLETLGNKPNVFGDNPYARPGISEEYEDYAIPGEYMTDQQFARMIQEAERYLGYPYVWGGSSPSTSFDCSGFVSYVINHCGNGWDYGRLTANGWRNATDRVQGSDVQAGDLVFFQGTYATSGASHVGIVVDPANKIMIHCGNPIQYASYDTPYWRQHAYGYGRLP